MRVRAAMRRGLRKSDIVCSFILRDVERSLHGLQRLKRNIQECGSNGVAKVFVTTHDYQADVKCFKVAHDYQADLLVYVVKNDYQASGDAKWFYVKHDYQATTKIFWVKHDYQADLKIFFVDHDYQAEWRHGHPLQQRL